MQIKTLIIEDLPDNREALATLLKFYCPQVEIIGNADNVADAYTLIQETQADLLFLDIQLRKKTGFDLLQQLYIENAIDFEIIFFTAHGNETNITTALQYSDLEFITKPIDPTKLRFVVEKATRRIEKEQYTAKIALLLENISKPALESKGIIIHLAKGFLESVIVDEIVWCKADGGITYIHLMSGKRYIAMKNLGVYVKMLSPDYRFFSISSSLLINMDYFKRYHHGKLSVSLTTGEVLQASRRGGRDFRRFLNDPSNDYNTNKTSKITTLLKKLFG